MSVIVVATISPTEGQYDAVKQVLLEAIPQVHAEPGCEFYALQEDGTRLVMVEKWESPEALATHSKAEALTRAGQAMGDKLAGPLDVRTFSAVPAGDPTKGAL